MNTLKLNRMEELFSIPNEVKTVRISGQNVLQFLYESNRRSYLNDKENSLNTTEIRNHYIDFLKLSSKQKLNPFDEELILNVDDIKTTVKL